MPQESKRILISWIGRTDLLAAVGGSGQGNGPVLQALKDWGGIDHAYHLASDLSGALPPPQQASGGGACTSTDTTSARTAEEYLEDFGKWLYAQWTTPTDEPSLDHATCGKYVWTGNNADAAAHSVTIFHKKKVKATDLKALYTASRKCCGDARKEYPNCELVFHFSPGTGEMGAVLLLLSKTEFPGTLIKSWKGPANGKPQVSELNVPFNITAVLHQAMKTFFDSEVSSDAFKGIVEDAEEEKQQKQLAAFAAGCDVTPPILLLGETGTGKEVYARAIHEASGRKGSFIPVNCGEIPEGLAESELFGIKKGAAADVTKDKEGLIQAAHNGTLFLDEIGELPLSLQVKLLRVLQEREVTWVGARKAVPVDFRLISATNRSLPDAVAKGTFRADLYYRIMGLPLMRRPLRERSGVGEIIKKLYDTVKAEARNMPVPDGISGDALAVLAEYKWPGNFREALSVLHVAAFYAMFDHDKAGQEGESPTGEQLEGNRQSDHTKPGQGETYTIERTHVERALAPATETEPPATGTVQVPTGRADLVPPMGTEGVDLPALLCRYAKYYFIQAYEMAGWPRDKTENGENGAPHAAAETLLQLGTNTKHTGERAKNLYEILFQGKACKLGLRKWGTGKKDQGKDKEKTP